MRKLGQSGDPAVGRAGEPAFSSLERAADLLRALQEHLERAASDGASVGARVADLEGRLAAAEADVAALQQELVNTERQVHRLMNLYVATYQLHSTLEPREVEGTIAEVAVNLLGAERFVLLLRGERGGPCEVAIAEGVDVSVGAYADRRYAGGDPLVDTALGEGIPAVGPAPGSTAVIAVPLTVQSEVVGALVVERLLAHKPGLGPDDRDLLDLIAAHAASALIAARSVAATQRKLRTLEGLVNLVRGGS